MRVLVVYAHPNPDSFSDAILEHVTRGLDESPHSYEVDRPARDRVRPGLHATGTAIQFMHESLPDELIEDANPARGGPRTRAGGPIRRYMARRWMRDKSDREIARGARRAHVPEDVRASSRRWSRAPRG